jgi:ADP-heptose:LPS heptosyltransferase
LINSVLVYVGLDLVGDAVMKLPFLASLRRCYPQARVTWMAGQGKTAFAGALAPLVGDLIDEIIEDAFAADRVALLRRPLPERSFDLLLDTQRRVMTSLRLRRIRHRIFISAAANWHLSDRLPPGGRHKRPSMIGQMLALLEAATGNEVDAAVPPPLPPALLAEAGRRLPPGMPYLGLAPGAGGRHKCWPRDRYLAVAAHFLARGWQPVFLLGPAERDWESEITRALPQAHLPLTDRDSPAVTIALATRLAAAVANDSGTGHMLAAAGIPLLSLFGPTSAEKFAPTSDRLTVIRAQEFQSQEMSAIPLAPVIEALSKLVGAPAP